MQSDEVQSTIENLSSADEMLKDLAYQELRITKNSEFLFRAIELLDSDSEDEYRLGYRIIESLHSLEHSQILEEVLNLLDHPIHCEWAIVMASRLDVDIAPRLLRFTTHPDAEIRYQVLRILEGYSGIFEMALYFLNDSSARIRGKAVRILESLQNPLAIPSLAGRLEDLEIGVAGIPVAVDAARALGKFGDAEAIPALRKAVLIDNEELGLVTIEALRLIDPQVADEYKEQHTLFWRRKQEKVELANLGE